MCAFFERDGLIARCPPVVRVRVRGGVGSGIVVLEGFLSGFARPSCGRVLRPAVPRREENSKTYGIFFYPHTDLPLRPSRRRRVHRRRHSAVTLHFGLPARNCRRVYNSCLSLSLLGRERTVRACVCTWVAGWAPIPLFYPHNTMMHL